MEIPACKMQQSIEKIYSLLDEVSPLDFDCGRLCDDACCVNDDNDDYELALYLMPGEELMYEDSDDFNLYYIPSDELEFPHDWNDDVYLVECINPPHCNRSIRPIQCRTFPLIPHLSRDDTFHLILDKSEFPYSCPIVDENMKLDDDFIKLTFNVWKILIKDPVVYDLIKYDSSLRDDRKSNYKIVI